MWEYYPYVRLHSSPSSRCFILIIVYSLEATHRWIPLSVHISICKTSFAIYSSCRIPPRKRQFTSTGVDGKWIRFYHGVGTFSIESIIILYWTPDWGSIAKARPCRTQKLALRVRENFTHHHVLDSQTVSRYVPRYWRTSDSGRGGCSSSALSTSRLTRFDFNHRLSCHSYSTRCR